MLIVDCKIIEEGILLDIRIKKFFGNKKFNFLKEKYSIIKKVYQEYPEIMVLEELYLQENLKIVENGYLIPFNRIDNIDKADLEELKIFHENDIKIHLRTQGHIDSENFKFIYDINSKKLGNIDRMGKRINRVFKYFDTLFLLNKDQYNLLNSIDTYSFVDKDSQYKFIARTKKLAKYMDLTMEDYISNENLYMFEKINLDVKKHDNNKLELIPESKSLPDTINELLSNQDRVDNINSYGEGLKRNRVFFDDDNKKVFNEIKEKRYIEGKDVPKFLENPFNFVPDEIDLKEFGERVKGLGIYNYQVKTSVDLSSKNEWFEFELGYDLETDDPDQESINMNLDDYEAIIKEATESNEDYIFYDDKWIKVDRKLAKEVEEIKDESLKAKTKEDIKYILEIFDNIDNLEYSEEYIKVKENEGDWGTFLYEKPKYLDANLYDYQKSGYVWLKELRRQRLGSLLADDMGLGKTMQVISYMADLLAKNELQPALLVLPKSLIDNWDIELNKFLKGEYEVLKYHGSNRIKDVDYITSYHIIMTTYDLMVRDQIVLGKINWSAVILDEVQMIKNATTYYSNAAKAMKAGHRIGLTGTPVENSLSELWSIIDFIQPGLLKSYSDFRREYEEPIEGEDKLLSDKKSKELREKIKPIFIRRMKEDELVGLPKKNIEFLECEFGTYQLELYQEKLKDIKPHTVHELIMISSHPRLRMNDYNVSSSTLIDECPKLKRTLELLEDIRKRKEKVIIFTKYKDMQRILKRVILDKFGIDTLLINGDISGNRLDIIKEFSSLEGFNIIILSPKAAGVGLNIIAANNVIHYTREWNPAIENQATDRVYRIGQEKDINIYYPTIVSKKGKTVEEELNNLLYRKLALAKNIIIPAENIKVTSKEIFDRIN